jgi:GT2 family glycosyltransferase
MVVLRWHRRVVGRAFLAVEDGTIGRETLTEVIAGAAGREALSLWLDSVLWQEECAATLRAPLPAATATICTRERPEDLDRALRGMMAQRRQADEILVVDNAPATDATRDVVARFPSVRYVVEPRRGLNVARNRALREARNEIVAFNDDDAVPEPEWLGSLLANFRDHEVACVTGLTLPLELETPAQELFEEHCPFARGFRRRTFDVHHNDPLAVGAVGAGANMAVRRSTVLDLGGFDERLDAGTPTRSGGDHDMFIRLLIAGHRIVYDPAALSWHRHRRTEEELLDTVYGYGVGVYAMWTGLLLERGEIGVVRLAWRWFRHEQSAILLGRSGGAARTRLARAELRGCLRGPGAWLAARRLRAVEG